MSLVDPARHGGHHWITSVLLFLLSRPSDFPKIFNKLPQALRAVAIEEPDDVITDIKSIVDKDERMAMTKRIGSTEKTNVKRKRREEEKLA